MVRMLERPTSIENVFEIKEWLDSVPATVKGYDEVIRRVITVSVLPLFFYYWFSSFSKCFTCVYIYFKLYCGVILRFRLSI